jgi:hypothetical protein
MKARTLNTGLQQNVSGLRKDTMEKGFNMGQKPTDLKVLTPILEK